MNVNSNQVAKLFEPNQDSQQEFSLTRNEQAVQDKNEKPKIDRWSGRDELPSQAGTGLPPLNPKKTSTTPTDEVDVTSTASIESTSDNQDGEASSLLTQWWIYPLLLVPACLLLVAFARFGRRRTILDARPLTKEETIKPVTNSLKRQSKVLVGHSAEKSVSESHSSHDFSGALAEFAESATSSASFAEITRQQRWAMEPILSRGHEQDPYIDDPPQQPINEPGPNGKTNPPPKKRKRTKGKNNSAGINGKSTHSSESKNGSHSRVVNGRKSDYESDHASSNVHSENNATDHEFDGAKKEAEAVFKSELEFVREELKKNNEKIDSLSTELNSWKQKSDELQSERSILADELEKLKKSTVESTQLKSAKSELDATKQELGVTHSELEDMKAELEKFRSEFEQAFGKWGETQAELDHAKSELDGIRNELDETRDQFRQSQDEWDSHRATTKEEIAELKEVKNKLKEKLRRALARANKYKKRSGTPTSTSSSSSSSKSRSDSSIRLVLKDDAPEG